jgi:tRNA threonylcarbamoyladenosine biosynthesis protein TsaB
MLILTIRTDKPDAEIGLFQSGDKLAYSTWPAHRQLAETIHLKIHELLESQGRRPEDIKGITVFKGPGSFTGLRVGLSVANALAYSLRVPIIGAASVDWLQAGAAALRQGQDDQQVMPEYGSPPHVTPPKK